MDFLWFVLSAFGITQIIVYGTIFDGLRPISGKLGQLFRCTMCVGFWVGLFLCGINYFTELFTFEYTAANFLICGSVSSSVSYALDKLFGDSGLQLFIREDRQSEYYDSEP